MQKNDYVSIIIEPRQEDDDDLIFLDAFCKHLVENFPVKAIIELRNGNSQINTYKVEERKASKTTNLDEEEKVEYIKNIFKEYEMKEEDAKKIIETNLVSTSFSTVMDDVNLNVLANEFGELDPVPLKRQVRFVEE